MKIIRHSLYTDPTDRRMEILRDALEKRRKNINFSSRRKYVVKQSCPIDPRSFCTMQRLPLRVFALRQMAAAYQLSFAENALDAGRVLSRIPLNVIIVAFPVILDKAKKQPVLLAIRGSAGNISEEILKRGQLLSLVVSKDKPAITENFLSFVFEIERELILQIR